MTTNPCAVSGMGVITRGHQTLDGEGNGGIGLRVLESLSLRRWRSFGLLPMGKRGKTCSSFMLRAHDLAVVHLRVESRDGTMKDWRFLDVALVIILLDLKGRAVYWYNRSVPSVSVLYSVRIKEAVISCSISARASHEFWRYLHNPHAFDSQHLHPPYLSVTFGGIRILFLVA